MRAAAGALALILSALPLQASPPAAPVVATVEPPSWWAGHSINPVRLLLRGRNLAGGRVSGSGGCARAMPA